MRSTFAIVATTALISTAAYAAPIDLSTMTLNGSAALEGSSIVLTPAAGFEIGSAFIDPGFKFTSATTFSVAFEIGFSDNGGFGPGGADGIAFVMHNDSDGANQLGEFGGGIGYAGIAPSIVLEFDTWNNGTVDDDSDNHVGISLNGNIDASSQVDPGFTIQDQSSLFGWVDYDGTTVGYSVSTTNVKPASPLITAGGSLSAFLNSNAYFGFTASTGSAWSKQQLKSLDVVVDSPHVPLQVVPLPAALPMLVAGLGIMGGLAARRRRKTA